MAVWLVRAGKQGVAATAALEQGVVGIGWADLPDLRDITTREAIAQLHRQAYPDSGPASTANLAAQVHAFRSRMQPGDLAVLPISTRAAVAVGRVVGDYEYRPDLPSNLRHARRVEWLATDVPRAAFDQDLLASFSANLTVCQVRREQAEARILRMLGRPAPPTAGPERQADGQRAEDAPLRVEEYARDQIVEHLSRRYRGHDLARLVAALLAAQGYIVETSPPGADGGVDILAGQGPLGFDPPRLCVQVKSGDQPLDVAPLRELRGVMPRFGAQQGLLVSWGGFKQSVLKEARQLFFQIRLWDAGDIVTALLEHYDRLPADLRAELPLKRIWTLVLEE